jgi:hypothetical protein
MEASARRLGAAHLSFSSFALSQGLAVRKFVKPLGESTESATAMPISEAAVSLIFRCVCPVPCTAASLVVLSIFIVHAMPIYTAAFGGRCGRSPRFGISWRLQIELQCELCYTAEGKMRAGTCVRVGFVPNCQSLSRGWDKSEVKASIILGRNVGDH